MVTVGKTGARSDISDLMAQTDGITGADGGQIDGSGKPGNASPTERSAALAIINSAGLLGQVGLIEGMGDPRLAYNLPPPVMAAPPAQQQATPSAQADKGKSTGSTATTGDDDKLYSTKAALLAAMQKAGIEGADGLVPADITDEDLAAVNAGDEDDVQSLKEIAADILARKQEKTPAVEEPVQKEDPPEDQGTEGKVLPAAVETDKAYV